MTDLERVDIPIERFNKAAQYKVNFVVQRYMLLSEDLSDQVIAALGIEDGAGARAFNPEDAAKLPGLLANLPDDLDSPVSATRRREQTLLRDILLGGKSIAECALCGRRLPVDLLWIGHIKKRHSCSSAEKKDINNVMVACVLGCDRLFENGYVSVDNEGIIRCALKRSTPGDVMAAITTLEGRKCAAWSPASESYFVWHRTHPRVFV